MHSPIVALLSGEMLSAQEMGDVGDEGDVVDEQLWGQDEDKPQQFKAEEKYEKDAPVQVIAQPFLPGWIWLEALVKTAKSKPRMGILNAMLLTVTSGGRQQQAGVPSWPRRGSRGLQRQAKAGGTETEGAAATGC